MFKKLLGGWDGGTRDRWDFVYFLAMSKSSHDVSGQARIWSAWSCPGSISVSWLSLHLFPEVLSGLGLLVLSTGPWLPAVGAGS